MKIKIKKVPRQPNIESYGGFLDAADNLFAIGGDVQMHGGDYSNGAIHINEGNSHEENPYDGVQVGVDPEGTPNLVEEGEVIFNDYVYSDRILCDDETKEKFHISKKREISFADLAKKLEKESSERPNDPISKAALKVQMESLAEEQERQKAEMQAEEAREAFEALSPEEQVAVMQQAEAQQADAQAQQEAMMQEQAMAEQQAAMQQQSMPMGIDAAMQGQMMPQGIVPEGGMMQAYGGLINQYGLGGNLFVVGGDKSDLARRVEERSGRSILGDNLFTKFMRGTASLLSDPIDYFLGDEIEALFDRLGSMAEPQLEKFFSTDVGQRVAQVITKIDNANSRMPKYKEAGKGSFGSFMGRTGKGFTHVFTAAKRAMQQSKLNARTQQFSATKAQRKANSQPNVGRNGEQSWKPSFDNGTEAVRNTVTRTTRGEPWVESMKFAAAPTLSKGQQVAAGVLGAGILGSSAAQFYNSAPQMIESMDSFFNGNGYGNSWTNYNVPSTYAASVEDAKEDNKSKERMEAAKQELLDNISKYVDAHSGLSGEERTMITGYIYNKVSNPDSKKDITTKSFHNAYNEALAEYNIKPKTSSSGTDVKSNLTDNEKRAYDWVRKEHPEYSEKEAIEVGKALIQEYKDHKVEGYTPTFAHLYSQVVPVINKSDSSREKHFNSLIEKGVSKETAFKMVYPEKETGGEASKIKHRDKLKTKLTGKAMPRGNNKYSSIAKTASVSFNNAISQIDGYDTFISLFNTYKRNGLSDEKARKLAYNGAKAIYNKNAAMPEKGRQKAALQGVQEASAEKKGIPTSPSRTTANGSGYNSNIGTQTKEPQIGENGWVPYGYYTNGNDGITEKPWGFTVDENGKVEEYTEEYRNLVNSLGAEDIRQWAKEHPNDPSLRSFLERGNKLEDLTDEMWRKGATDGKYGFMHHVANKILEDTSTPTEKPTTIDTSSNNNIYHAVEGDDEYVYGVNPDTLGRVTRTEHLPNGDTVIYHTSGDPAIDNAKVEQEDASTAPIKAKEPPIFEYIPKYFGLGDLGPLVALGMQVGGIGKPDYSGTEAAVAAARNGLALADYRTAGNYFRYNPMDVWAAMNRQDANTRATERALLNSSMPVSNRAAGLLANNYQGIIGDGELYNKGWLANADQALKKAQYDTALDQFNAGAFNQTSATNTQLLNHNRQFLAQLMMQKAREDAEARASWYRGIYGNVDNLFEGLGKHERENRQGEMIAGMINTGLFGRVSDETPLIENTGYRIRKNTGAKGGKLNRKKRKGGLTY